MKFATTAKILATGLALLLLVFEVAANDPIFVKWLVMDDPGDETIRVYWQRAEAGELSGPELVDLGTMLFYRGWPNDAVDYFKQALKLDSELSEAWFRLGLVKHYSGDLAGARSAYEKCLKLQSGHAWANFYLGLLEEQTGDASAAMGHFEMAFQRGQANSPQRDDPSDTRLHLHARAHQKLDLPFERRSCLATEGGANLLGATTPTRAYQGNSRSTRGQNFASVSQGEALENLEGGAVLRIGF